MRVLMLIGLLAVGQALATDPNRVCPKVGEAAFESGVSTLSNNYNIARAEAHGILSDPKYSDNAWNAVDFHRWSTEQAATPAGKTFFAAMAKRLALPEYSSTDPAKQSQLRWAAVQQSLSEAGLSVPSNVASLLWTMAEAYPTIQPATPITMDLLAVRRREFFDSLPTETWVSIYRGFYKLKGGKYKPSPFAAAQPLPNPNQVRSFLTNGTRQAGELGVKQRLEDHLVKRLGTYIVGRNIDEIDIWLGKEFSDYCKKNEIPATEERVLRDYIRYLFRQEPPTVYNPGQFPREWTNAAMGAVHDLRRGWAADERERQRVADANRPAPVPPPIAHVVLPPVQSHRPMRRPLPTDTRDEAPAPRPVALVFKPLTPEQEAALFVRLSPSDTHHSHFIKALDRLERKLNEAEYNKLYGRIVETLWRLEHGADPTQLTHLGRTTVNGLWDLKPLGTAFTIRFFIGKSGRHVRILALEDDVKSGDAEHRIIMDLKDQWKHIEHALPK